MSSSSSQAMRMSDDEDQDRISVELSDEEEERVVVLQPKDNYLGSVEAAIQWCGNFGLLPNGKSCSACKSYSKKEVEMNFFPKRGNDFGTFICNKTKQHRDHKAHVVSGLTGTWFENTKLDFRRVLLLTYCFVRKMSYSDTIAESSVKRIAEHMTSSSTVTDWFSYCREVCLDSLDKDYETQIGGPGTIVEIDETKVGKRKYNRGRMVEGNWVFGMVQRGSKQLRLEICPENKRDSITLLGLLEKHVLPGTMIYSDMWKAYDCLPACGYGHLTVNHSVTFKDPITGCHTNTIESNWRPLKNRVERGGVGGKKKFAEHLCEYLWMREHKKDDDIFLSFMRDVKALYDPNK